jgi:hypothetical protein
VPLGGNLSAIASATQPTSILYLIPPTYLVIRKLGELEDPDLETLENILQQIIKG